jgi:surface carbohydrate biosynthesis protein
MFNRKKVDVLILIEHRTRELESAVLLKYFLEKKGYCVIIDSIKFHKESVILKYKPSIAIVPWAYSNKEIDLFRCFNSLKNKKNTLILNMHHEQISNDGSDSFIIPKDDAKKTLHVSWGKNYTKKLLSAGCSENTIIQCGNPRLDFYKGNLKKISDGREKLSYKYNLDSRKKWVLFIANSFHLLSEKQININTAKGVDIKEQIDSSIKNRNDFLYYVDNYLSESDDVIFIYRPHPSFAHVDTKSPEIVELCNKHKNFKCIYENSIRDWIINSDIAISFHSTSIIECAVSETPFYLFRSHELSPDKDYRFFTNYEYVIKDYEGFCEAINTYKKFSYERFIESIKEYIHLNTNTYSTQIIADELNRIFNSIDNYYEGVDFKIKPYIKTVLYFLLKRVLYLSSKISFVKNMMLNSKDIRFFNLLYTGDDYFNEDDIQEIENKIRQLLDFQNNL